MKTIFKLLIWTAVLIPGHAGAQFITTIAGNGISGTTGDGGPATAAELYDIYGAIGYSGNLYFAEFIDSRVRVVNSSAIIATLTGTGSSTFGGDGHPASTTAIGWPSKILEDATGNIYIAEEINSCIRKINTSGIMTTVVGIGGDANYTGDGGPATAATINYAFGMAFDSAENMYIADYMNNRIRKVNTMGIISTIAGTGGFLITGDGGPATAAQINKPIEITCDRHGNLYITENEYHNVRKITPSGIISNFAGTGTPGYSGDGGSATLAQLNYPQGLFADSADNIYIADLGNSRIRKVTSAGIISTIAGNGITGYSGDGGAATNAKINQPQSVTMDASGRIYISDNGNNVIRMITTQPAPRFSAGSSGSLIACGGYSSSINDLLAVVDSASGTIVNWTLASAPTHGTAVVTYSVTSGGGTLTPTGLTYLPVGGYGGPDMFKVSVADCCNPPDTLTVSVLVTPFPVAGAISGADTVCATGTVTLDDTSTMGMWGITNSNASVSSGIVTGISPGTDTVIYIESNECGSDTAAFAMTVSDCPSGVKPVNSANLGSLELFPNPNDGTFSINLESATNEPMHLTISNAMGQVIREIDAFTNSNCILSLDVPAGFYFINTTTSTSSYNNKFVINK